MKTGFVIDRVSLDGLPHLFCRWGLVWKRPHPSEGGGASQPIKNHASDRGSALGYALKLKTSPVPRNFRPLFEHSTTGTSVRRVAVRTH
jgi:hypothetical protein